MTGSLAVEGTTTPLIFEGNVLDTFETFVTVTEPTVDRTVSVPNADSMTVISKSCPVGQAVLEIGPGGVGVVTCGIVSDVSCVNCIGTGEIDVLLGAGVASPFLFEGSIADAFETRMSITEPTADRTFTVPNADSTAIQPLTCGGGQTVTAVSAVGAITCAAVSSSAWSALSNPSGNLSLAMNNNQTTFTWGNNTVGPMMLLQDTVGNIGTGPILKIIDEGAVAAQVWESGDGTATVQANDGVLRPTLAGEIHATHYYGDQIDGLITLVNGVNDPITLLIGGTKVFALYTIQGPTGAFTVAGTDIAPIHGTMLVLYNSTAQNMTVRHNNSAGGQPFWTMNAADHTTTGQGIFTFVYDDAGDRWILMTEQL